MMVLLKLPGLIHRLGGGRARKSLSICPGLDLLLHLLVVLVTDPWDVQSEPL